jgi:hypothetical protein
MCLSKIIWRKHYELTWEGNYNLFGKVEGIIPLTKREKKKVSLIRDYGIGYKLFLPLSRKSYYCEVDSFHESKWVKARNIRIFAGFDHHINYISGFHLFYNLSAAIEYGKNYFYGGSTIPNNFIVSSFEYKDVTAVGFEGSDLLCIVANEVRLIRHNILENIYVSK